ncbi:MAG: glycosyltransferase, partial [Patescibacteria group bacterium]
NNALAVVIPSIWFENMPFSLLESLAIGKIVIASRIGGIPEIIKDGVNGILFDPNNSDDLAKKINQSQKININNIKINAITTMKNFSQEKHYESIIDIYNTIMR